MACAGLMVDHNAPMVKTAPHAQAAHPGDSAGGMAASSRVWPVLAAGLLWLAAAFSAGYWVLQAWGRTPVVSVAAAPLDTGAPDTAQVARALGAASAAPLEGQEAPAFASRYILLGVIAGRARQGAALIAVDDQPPKPYRVGATVEGGLVLQSVGKNTARLGPSSSGPATVELAVPAQGDQPS
jgi:general secretion pathway protein C